MSALNVEFTTTTPNDRGCRGVGTSACFLQATHTILTVYWSHFTAIASKSSCSLPGIHLHKGRCKGVMCMLIKARISGCVPGCWITYVTLLLNKRGRVVLHVNKVRHYKFPIVIPYMVSACQLPHWQKEEIDKTSNWAFEAGDIWVKAQFRVCCTNSNLNHIT